MSNTNINIRVDSNIKSAAQELFSNLGLDMSTAINIFLRQSINYGGLPFEVRQPKFNKETLAAMQETEDIINGKIKTEVYSSAEELFNVLDKEVYN